MVINIQITNHTLYDFVVKNIFEINQTRIFYPEKFDKLIINDSLNSKNVLHYFEEQEIAWIDDDSTFFSN